nr:PREDICTED: TATA box-binding protein-associated factor RNA polymerase I subunit A-like isoform X1 [Equus przewalskii]
MSKMNYFKLLTKLEDSGCSSILSTECVFQLCALQYLKETLTVTTIAEKEEHHKLGLEVLFGVLDFAGCTKNITAWKYLAKCLRQTLMRSHLAWVQEEWSSRKNWWPGFHFSYFWAKSDWKEDKALACEKALVAGVLSGKKRYMALFSFHLDVALG